MGGGHEAGWGWKLRMCEDTGSKGTLPITLSTVFPSGQRALGLESDGSGFKSHSNHLLAMIMSQT